MEIKRKPFQGLINIIIFNFHYYLVFIVGMVLLMFLFQHYPGYRSLWYGGLCAGTALMLNSFFVSYLVYDRSSLYQLTWLDQLNISKPAVLVNLHAGLDEISGLLKLKFPLSELIVCDFYNPLVNTEWSIKIARKKAVKFPNTLIVKTASLPLENKSADLVVLFLSVHEIRSSPERENFFFELERILKYSGKIVVVEHLRDIPNFFAFNIGFFHFYPRQCWIKTFYDTGFAITAEIKITPFIHVFELQKS